MIRLGDEVRDTVDEVQGTVIRVAVEGPNACRLIGIPRTFVQDGVPVEILHWIKEENAVVTKEKSP